MAIVMAARAAAWQPTFHPSKALRQFSYGLALGRGGHPPPATRRYRRIAFLSGIAVIRFTPNIEILGGLCTSTVCEYDA